MFLFWFTYLLSLYLKFTSWTGGDKNSSDSLISVIIPCYNCRADWLKETIDSLQNQTIVKNLQVILVDDGSHPALINPPRHSFKKFILFRHPKNRGLSAARNSGVKLASSPFIIFLDPDDVIVPNCLEKLLLAYYFNSQDLSNLGWVYPGTVQFRTTPDGLKLPFYYHAIKYSKRRLFSLESGFIPSFALIPRNLYNSVGKMCDIVRGYEDYDFWLRLAVYGYQGMVLDEELFWYRRHDKGRTAEIEARELLWREELRENNINRLGPCYPRKKVDFVKTPFIDLTKINLNTLGEYTYLMIPWMERGGAEQYELDLLKCLPDAARIVIITDSKSFNPYKSKYSQFKNVEIFHLSTLNLNTFEADFVEYMFRVRPPKQIIIRNSWLGYEIAKKYPHFSFITVDIHHLPNKHFEQLSMESSIGKSVLITDRIWLEGRSKVIIPPMVDKTIWKLESPNHKNAKTRVAFIGRFVEQKDPSKWTRITKELASELWIPFAIGEGPLRKQLVVEELYEWIDDPLIFKKVLLLQPTVLLLTSQEEGLPISVLQCLSIGIPVVAPKKIFHPRAHPLLFLYDDNSSDQEIRNLLEIASKGNQSTDNLLEILGEKEFCEKWNQVLLL
jgi:glycosyltransferase involved in cell wall biosynthesis